MWFSAMFCSINIKFRSTIFKGLRVWATSQILYAFSNWLYVNSWGNPKNEIEIFNKWQKIKLSLVFA
ncbi:hypothetical protein, partial [Ruminococcus sp.]|uniref:hypothetical protein n=1 Tax=Ruminococcus sp. TaxID=41978 RepID=UPI003F816948